MMGEKNVFFLRERLLQLKEYEEELHKEINETEQDLQANCLHPIEYRIETPERREFFIEQLEMRKCAFCGLIESPPYDVLTVNFESLNKIKIVSREEFYKR